MCAGVGGEGGGGTQAVQMALQVNRPSSSWQKAHPTQGSQDSSTATLPLKEGCKGKQQHTTELEHLAREILISRVDTQTETLWALEPQMPRPQTLSFSFLWQEQYNGPISSINPKATSSCFWAVASNVILQGSAKPPCWEFSQSWGSSGKKNSFP